MARAICENRNLQSTQRQVCQ
ncbi:hypothetical protein LGR65_01870 [Enterobacter hormaechei]|nr:hypothetical protein [Enterobacter hormaechei]MCF2342158.1 hypothetical protein [Enterobacter hormaechei]MCF2373724.1 hypothetical protein [Enterobacter hormaechei]